MSRNCRSKKHDEKVSSMPRKLAKYKIHVEKLQLDIHFTPWLKDFDLGQIGRATASKKKGI